MNDSGDKIFYLFDQGPILNYNGDVRIFLTFYSLIK